MRWLNAVIFYYSLLTVTSVLAGTDVKLFTATTDTRNYSLTVRSAYGVPIPNIGNYTYAWNSTVIYSAPAFVIDQGINWRNVGWTGTGLVPANGATNITGNILLTNVSSSITWNWSAGFTITNVVAAQRPGTKLVDITYDLISDVTNAVPISFQIKNGASTVLSTSASGALGADVLPGTDKSIVWNMGTDWNTNSAVLSYTVKHSTQTNFSISISAPSDSRDYTLTVSSAHGTPDPFAGINLYAWASMVTCSVDTAVYGNREEDNQAAATNWFCTGWSGTGSVPASGNTNITDAIVLTNLNSSISWLWIATFDDLAVEYVRAAQRPGTKLVDVQYDIHSSKTGQVAVTLAVFDGSNAVNAASVSGDAGTGVPTGENKSLVWDAAADWNDNFDNLTFRILGQDAQGAGTETPSGRVRIPAGQNSGTDPDSGAYSLSVSNSLFMDAGEVTKAQWDRVAEWAVTNGYSFSNVGNATGSNHPVQTISWYDAAKWCNARSQMEGAVPCYSTNDWSCDFSANGYRLPTVAEWQYAARGGLSGKRFPWGDTITHSNDTYYSSDSYAYDVSTTRGFHPLFGTGTAPAGTGTTNGYGLTEMSGNVMEWCNDTNGANRTLAGGSWDQYASEARCTYTSLMHPSAADYNIGFRTVQRASSAASAETGSAIPVDTRDYQLVVSSAHGSPVPGIGTNLYAWRASVTCSVDSSVISGLTNWTSAGWSGSGSVSSAGSTNRTGSLTLTNLISSITWRWNTNYWLEASAAGSGSVSPKSGWKSSGSNVSLSVTPSNGWLFMGWSGDTSGDYTQGSILIPMVRPVSITATFSDDADSDGLMNTNETALGTDPRRKDSDGDGMDDPHELIAGTAPTNSSSLLDIQLNLSGSANELTWYGVSGRYYRLEYTDHLSGTWLPKGSVVSGANGQVMRLDVGAGSNRFYRIRVSDSPAGF